MVFFKAKEFNSDHLPEFTIKSSILDYFRRFLPRVASKDYKNPLNDYGVYTDV